MADSTARFRPKTYPPPEFPPRQPRLFARTPPAVFAPILGLLGLGLALRRGQAAFGWSEALADLMLGMAVLLWAFAVVAYLGKMMRRPGVMVEDMRVLPGRAGLAAASVGGMATAAALAPFAPGFAYGILLGSLAVHGVQAALLLRQHLTAASEARGVSPADHLGFVGFIVGGLAAASLGKLGLAEGLLWATLPVAIVIWGLSARQLWSRIPPAPLRPMLAIHLAPASLFASVAALVGQAEVAQGMMGLATLILIALLVASRWITESGFSPMWGALTFPLSAYAGAGFVVGGLWAPAGGIGLAAALIIVPVIAYRVLKLWPQGALGARTNAAEA